MRIQELYLKNFGKFYQQRFFIRDGIHVFYGENEYGKSTIYAFIKAMLFGVERGRGRASRNDEYSRYEPWENPNYYAGVMRFTCAGKHFLLERNFDRYQKSARLICEDDGEELSVEDGDLTMLLDGMTRSDFENTVAVGQLAVESREELVEALKNYAANYSATMDSELNLKQALASLKMKRKEAADEQKVQTKKRQDEQERMRIRQEYLLQDMERLKERMDGLEADAEEREEEKTTGSAESAGALPFAGTFPLLACGCVLLLVAVAAFLGILPVLQDKTAVCAGIFGVGIVLIVLGILSMRKKGKIPDIPDGQEWERKRLLEEYQEKSVQYQNLEEAILELEEPKPEEQRLSHRIQALKLAEDTLSELAQNMAADFETKFNENASAILSAVTDGAYSRLILEPDGELYLYAGETYDADEKMEREKTGNFARRRVSVRQVSRGTAEQVYFAFRMAAAQVLTAGDFPLILDETFAFYDEHRLKSTLKWLREQPRQVIIFTCQKREMEVLKTL